MPITGTVVNSPVTVSGAVAVPGSSGGTVAASTVIVSGAVMQRPSLSGLVLTLLGEGGGVSDGLINVKDSPYNAVGDGVTNDTAALIAALAAAEATDTQSPVYFPPGTYRITSPLTPFDGLRMVATGRGSEFGHGAIIKNLVTDMFTPTADVNDMHLEGLQFIGDTDNTDTNWWTPDTGFEISYSMVDKCGFTGFRKVYWGDWTGVLFSNFFCNGSDTTIQQFKVSGADNTFGPGFVGSGGFDRTTLTVNAPAHASPNTITVADASNATIGNPVYIGNLSNGASATRDITFITGVSGNQITIGTLANSHVAGEYVHIVMSHAAVESQLSHSKIDRLYISPGPGMALHVTGGHTSVYLNCELSGAPAESAGPGLYVVAGQGHQFIGVVLSSVAQRPFGQFDGALVVYDSVDLSFNGLLFDNITATSAKLIKLNRSGNVGVFLTDRIRVNGSTSFNVTGTATALAANAAMATAAGVGAVVDYDGFPRIKAGAPTDTDFFSLARDGLTCTDTSNSRFYTRVGGTWKYAALT